MRSRREREDGTETAMDAAARAPGKATLTGRVQRKAGGAAAPEGPAGAASAIAGLGTGGGEALPEGTRGSFEQAIGADLGAVRVHTGAASAEAAGAAGARAFALGNDIHFGAGQYQPEDPFGLHLLAHEVAHTQQPGAGPRFKLEAEDGQVCAEEERELDKAGGSRRNPAEETEADKLARIMVPTDGTGPRVPAAAGSGEAAKTAGNPSAMKMSALLYPDGAATAAMDTATLEAMAKAGWSAIKKTAAGKALKEAASAKMSRLLEGAGSSSVAVVLSTGVVVGVASALVLRMAQTARKALPPEVSVVMNAFDLDDLSAVGLSKEFGLKLEFSGPLAFKGPGETKAMLTITYKPGAGSEHKRDEKQELAKQTMALAKSLRLWSGGGDDGPVDLRSPIERKYSGDDPLHPKPLPAPEDPLAAGAEIAHRVLAGPYVFGAVEGFAAQGATVSAGDAAALRKMAKEIEERAGDGHDVQIVVYGHVGEGEAEGLAAKRAEAVAAVLRGAMDARIEVGANQTKGSGGRKAVVTFHKQEQRAPVELPLPTRAPVE